MEHESTRQCPNCEAQINDDAVLCIQCGFNVRTEEGIPAEFNFKETGSANSVDVGGWIALAIGLALALSVSFIPLLGPTLSSLTILVHEIGHAATSWLFGYPAIPAFDFSHGGGISSHFGRSTFILIILLLAQVGLIFAARKSKRLMGTAIGLSVLWALAAFTELRWILILFMGHGMELIIAGVFIYRAISGASIENRYERPLYAMTGFFIVGHDLNFAWGVMHRARDRFDYLQGKGGMAHDFVRLANDHLHAHLKSVLFVFFILCFLPPVLSFLYHRYRESIVGVFHD